MKAGTLPLPPASLVAGGWPRISDLAWRALKRASAVVHQDRLHGS